MSLSSLSRRAVVGAALSGAVVAATAGPARAASRPAPAPPGGGPARRIPPAPAPVPPLNVPALRAALSDLEHPQLTAAQLRVTGSAGHWYGNAGVADRDTGRGVHERDTFRIGSITKVFVATVVLQLAAERRLSPELPVQRLLPGLLPAKFPPITVLQLLNHTSGLPDEQDPPYDPTSPEEIARHRYDRWTPEQLVARVTHGPMKFTPGTKQEYRSINYILLALLIERLTGRRYGEVIARRILRPLGLRHTSVPGNDPRIHGPHVHGYMRMTDGSLLDITEFDQSAAWGGGEMISHTGDLDRFLTALFSGELLPPHELERMFTLPPDEVRMVDGGPARYAAGLQNVTMNGITLWGKTGERYGYCSAMIATRDQQRRAVFSFNPTRRDATQAQVSQRIGEALTKA
ncbi:serine hydrolase domain-containing protein [Streptomyces sp. Isolate_219]|uniref:serine hydrolase domain-containing protein n=1 Tax=Streptomyces sp. Isolate_219 TaxID=2950110 RepID=UPI0021C8EE62|nr:serine hydrolase domain-containing protein [Streptomyces sp. Isolate_219]MCR8575753.1 beta-lactamase family protein [Streptomyces sp. Isolate_219]